MKYLTELNHRVNVNECIQVLTTVNDEKKAGEIALAWGIARKITDTNKRTSVSLLDNWKHLPVSS